MRKRWIVAAGLLLVIPMLAVALLRSRTETPAEAQTEDAPPLPEAIADLQRRIDNGDAHLIFSEQRGYLRSLLETLDIPVSSQSLVFGKNSAQLFLIAPEAPRAVYFNDEVYVGYVQGAPHLEIASMDATRGPVFYTLDQEPAERPQFTLQPTDCLACHDTFDSERPVPRLLMLSVLSDPKGVALNRLAIVTNDKSPFIERWGGWYVTGAHGNQRHMGNSFVRAPAESLPAVREYAKRADLNAGANVTSLDGRFDVDEYPIPDSDIAALMVLGHQTHVHNLITVAHYALRPDSPEDSIEHYAGQIADAMLFVEAVPLTEPVQGTTDFAGTFSARGPKDSRGRSLHQLDLQARLLRYPLSYLVYSKSFDALPRAARDRIYRKFWDVLSGRDQSPAYAHLSEPDRKAILEILQETKPDFAAFTRNPG